MIIGITGSSGAGKSTVSEVLKEKYNAKIINADEIAKKLSKKGTKYLKDIERQFGGEILTENGELNREKLANLIYNSHEKRKLLNQCTFVHIKREIEKQIQEGRKLKTNRENSKEQETNKKLIIIDAPLLLEANLEAICDITIAVISEDRELQITRIVQRDNINKEQAIIRLNAQEMNEFYIEKCDYVIKNNDEIEDIKYQLKKILNF